MVHIRSLILATLPLPAKRRCLLPSFALLAAMNSVEMLDRFGRVQMALMAVIAQFLCPSPMCYQSHKLAIRGERLTPRDCLQRRSEESLRKCR